MAKPIRERQLTSDAQTVQVAGRSVEFRSIDALIPYARNARTHSAEQVAQLQAEPGADLPGGAAAMVVDLAAHHVARLELGLRAGRRLTLTGVLDDQGMRFVKLEHDE